MRGGAIPLLIWAFLLALLLGTQWFWSHDGLDTGLLMYGVTTMIVWLVVLVARRPHVSLRKGPPSEDGKPEALPTASIGSVMLAVALVCSVYAFEFGHFLYYFGGGLAVVAVGVLAREHYHQRQALKRWRRGDGEE